MQGARRTAIRSDATEPRRDLIPVLLMPDTGGASPPRARKKLTSLRVLVMAAEANGVRTAQAEMVTVLGVEFRLWSRKMPEG